ncbi:MAG: hypothetical protein PUF95_01425, partial [Selenomonadaceae bacterium]|nr:hypothetical protein [Selenomonadaceae bacterium]
DVITFYEQGTKKYLATDPAIVSAVNGMGRDNSSMALALFNAGVRVARACFVTINPTFAIRNLIADTQDAMIYSEYGYKPWDFVQGFMHALKRDDVFYEWMASGAAQASALSLDRDYTRSTIDKMTRSTKDKITNPKTWLNWLQWAGEVSEYGTRIGVYQRTKDAVGNKDNLSAGILEAAYESRDLMDFARGGKASRHLNKIALFANASIQGMDKFRRAFDPRDKKQFMRSVSRLTFTAMLPALLLALAHYDDDWYDELPDWMKESHWILGKVGDTIIRIPKGHDVAIRLVSNFIEKAISKTDKVTLANQFKPLKDALPSLMPMGLLPVIESWTNYSMFTEGPVVPGYLSKLPEDKQYNARTTWLARTIGDVFGYSPMKIDHIMEGYSGNVYKGGMEFINWMARDNKSAPHITDLPVISGVTYMPYKNPASVTKFYNEFDKLQKQHAYYNQTHEKLPGYSEEKYKKMMKASKKMSELSRKERGIVADEKLTVAKRYELQRQIQEKRLQLARSVMK